MRMSDRVESALWWCGRDGVFQRRNRGHWDVRAKFPDHEPAGTADIVCTGATLDDAGEATAREFARRLRLRADAYVAQAEQIERKLEER